jgi:hypothetical protein
MWEITKRLKLARVLYRAKKSADRIVRFVFPPFAFILSVEGKLDERMQGDEFLLSYLYGVFTCFVALLDVTDPMEAAFTLAECYEKLFPGKGRQVVDFCGPRLQARDERFMRGYEKGLQEAKAVAAALGRSVEAMTGENDWEATVSRELDERGLFPSLVKHLVRLY